MHELAARLHYDNRRWVSDRLKFGAITLIIFHTHTLINYLLCLKRKHYIVYS